MVVSSDALRARVGRQCGVKLQVAVVVSLQPSAGEPVATWNPLCASTFGLL
jgi:hypothetical protein